MKIILGGRRLVEFDKNVWVAVNTILLDNAREKTGVRGSICCYGIFRLINRYQQI